MRIAQIGLHRDPADRPPEELLCAWPTLVDVAECASRAGVQVSVIQASGHLRSIQQNGVDYHFLPGGFTADGPGVFASLIRKSAPQVLHVHGLGFSRQVSRMAESLPGTPILLQDHADRVPRWWRRPAWRRCATLVSGVAFCSRLQAQPFLDSAALERHLPVYEIPESTSRFTPGDREASRRATAVAGDPLLLWVGHLDDNKDPLTVLDGVAEAARALPGLQLWCCFGKPLLLPQLRRRLASDPTLDRRVHLLGRVSHAQIEQLMRAADAFVSGSHREGSGYALIEALACGLPPVVTDIPSFRALTGNGAVGQLWRAGNARSLCSALLALTARTGADDRAAVRAHFERELSFEAVGRKLLAAYQDLAARRQSAPEGAGDRLAPAGGPG